MEKEVEKALLYYLDKANSVEQKQRQDRKKYLHIANGIAIALKIIGGYGSVDDTIRKVKEKRKEL